VTGELGKRSRAEMGKLGLAVDAVEIQQLEDTAGYIADLAAPHAATSYPVQSTCSVGSAQ
jgi:flotillin